MRKLLPFAFSFLLLAGLLALLGAAAPAAAQCEYTLDWDFETELGEEWEATGVEWDGSGGHTAAGRMAVDGTVSTSALLTAAEILALLDLDSGYQILAEDVDFIAWSLELDASANHRSRQVINTSIGGTVYFYNEDEGSWYYGWISDDDGGVLESIGVGSYINGAPGTDVYFDDIQLSIPCENVGPPPTPTPTPTLTPTPIAGFGTPIPTPTPGPGITVTGGGGGFTTTVDIPGPVDIPEFEGEPLWLDFLWDWELLRNFISIVRTYPVLLERFSFTPVLVALGAILIVFRALTGVRNYRHQQRLAGELSDEDRARIDAQLAAEEQRQREQAYRRRRRR